jgi:GTPase SAR1 family protein
VVGNQSDGKSSFVEGLLGFQFNIVASSKLLHSRHHYYSYYLPVLIFILDIGTRRPLIIQMVNNPSMTNPSCKFRKERMVSEGEDPFEEEETPIENISEEIESRTNNVCGNGDTVSAVPIILRVEYSQCANLTIWDMPGILIILCKCSSYILTIVNKGFRHGGDKKLSQQILMLSERVMSMKNRIIICVEQSTTEWANSSSRPIVRKLDPDFSRTVLVNTKLVDYHDFILLPKDPSF